MNSALGPHLRALVRPLFGLVLALGLGCAGAGAEGAACFLSSDCAAGFLCAHYRGPATWDECRVPCSATSICPSVSQTCGCPADGGTSARCEADDGAALQLCLP